MTTPDVQGVRVWHHEEVGAGGAINAYEPHGYQCRSCRDGVWHDLSPAAQAARREAVIRVLPALSASDELRIANAVLRVLGLTTPGAS